MSESQGALTHVAFTEELKVHEADTPDWRAASAGLAVLRLVQTLADGGPSAVTPDALGVRTVRVTVEEVTERNPVRALLASVVDALEASPVSNLQSVAPRLMAYGQALEYDAKMALAADVYRLVIAYTHPAEDADVAIMAHLRLGYCLRMLNEMQSAMLAYESAGRLATAVGDTTGVLRARIGEAQLAMRRGNLPRAEEVLDDAIAQATTPELRDVRSRALHDRSTVAHHRGQFELAIRLGFDALECATSPRDRDRILGDIAASFVGLGVFAPARDAYLVLAETAQEQYVRWASVLNLMDIAARELAQPAFERYRRELEAAPLPGDMRASFELMAGQGYRRMGEMTKASAYLKRARTHAATQGFGQILFDAEKELLMLGGTRRTPTQAAAAVPNDLTEVASLLRQMRQAALSR